MKHIVSFSGGKDSTAMLLMMIEKQMQIDDIVFADTTLEFPEMYEHINMIEKFIKRPITRLKPASTWDSWFYGEVRRGNHKRKIRGFPGLTFHCYWHREAKFKPFQKYKNDIQYLGIAVDEKRNLNPNYKYPLIEWGITENNCREYLKKSNLLSSILMKFKRTGCWLCPKQSKASICTLCKEYPTLWKRLREYDKVSAFPKLNLNKIEAECCSDKGRE